MSIQTARAFSRQPAFLRRRSVGSGEIALFLDVTERGMGAHSGPQIHIDADEIAAIGDFSEINNGSIGGRENPPDFGNG